MSKKKNEVKEFFNSPGVKLVMIIAMPMIAILLLIMIFTITRLDIVGGPRLVIDDFAEELPEVPEDTRRRIEEKLYAQVEESGVSVVPEDGAMIREGSIDGFAVQRDLYVGDFIVDIDVVQESYIIKYYYGELNGGYELEASASVMLYCIENPDEVIYGDFQCLANHDYVKPDPIQYVLPREFEDYILSYTYSLTSESGYAVVVTYDPPESIYLSGRVEEFENESMGKIREFLIESGVEPDRYEFVVKYRIVE